MREAPGSYMLYEKRRERITARAWLLGRVSTIVRGFERLRVCTREQACARGIVLWATAASSGRLLFHRDSPHCLIHPAALPMLHFFPGRAPQPLPFLFRAMRSHRSSRFLRLFLMLFPTDYTSVRVCVGGGRCFSF